MESSRTEVAHEVLPYMRVYKDGTIERLAGTQFVAAGFDADTGVLSEDVVAIPETGVSVRIYRPGGATNDRKLPVVLYFQGGAFCIASIGEPFYHHSLNRLVAEANIVLVSVDYRRAPEHPLPTAYDDSRDVLKWVLSHRSGDGPLRETVDFNRVFLAGDSAGANIAHHLALEKPTELNPKIVGIIMIHPYFWGKQPIGSEITDPARREMVNSWWRAVCPTEKGNDDPLINPFVDGSPSLSGLDCDRVIVCVAEKDILRERGRLYYEKLKKSGWGGIAEFMEIEGEDHVFHIFDPKCEKAMKMIKCLANFINKN